MLLILFIFSLILIVQFNAPKCKRNFRFKDVILQFYTFKIKK